MPWQADLKLQLRPRARTKATVPRLSEVVYVGTYCLIYRGMNPAADHFDKLTPLPRRTPPPRRTGRYALLLITILLVANAFVGERGFVTLFRTGEKHAQLQQVIDTLRDENSRLYRYVNALKNEPRFIEELARRELGLIHPGEHFFIVETTTVPTNQGQSITKNAGHGKNITNDETR